MKKIIMVLVPSLWLIACSSSDSWSYEFDGSSKNWQAVVNVVPNEQNGAEFIGKLKKLSNKKITYIHYEADVTYSSHSTGNIDNPNFGEADSYIELFHDIPNTEQYRKEFKNGVDEREIKDFFGNYPVFRITWKDEKGEHTETLNLKYVETR
ncbi:hypothetical protein [Brevibacillus centrosporus]|uniref:hypothetical protein n=1 Tax=Brevibacillus centrosporus TaxID=54910 RepID=UPI003B02130E